MALQNKVLPSGEIVARPMQGQFMGNRGGRFHDPEIRQLHPKKRWANRQWISCLTSFKSRQRKVMSQSYTELFFLDEVTALAAGHRPCFECRREAAKSFAQCWAKVCGLDQAPKVAEMDKILHQQRLGDRQTCLIETHLQVLPDGAMVQQGDRFYAVKEGAAYQWSLTGYEAEPSQLSGSATLLTPPIINAILKAGYQPKWHFEA